VISQLLQAYGITSAQSSDATRCTQTLRFFAKSAGVAVHQQPTLSEQGYEANPRKAEKRARRIARDPVATVLCTHRPVLPAVMAAAAEALGGSPDDPAFDPKLAPGAFIVLHRTFDSEPRLVAAERHEVGRGDD
jgi:8-oxo-dGTP diphosphatase